MRTWVGERTQGSERYLCVCVCMRRCGKWFIEIRRGKQNPVVHRQKLLKGLYSGESSLSLGWSRSLNSQLTEFDQGVKATAETGGLLDRCCLNRGLVPLWSLQTQQKLWLYNRNKCDRVTAGLLSAYYVNSPIFVVEECFSSYRLR